jgi:hypothetical protein
MDREETQNEAGPENEAGRQRRIRHEAERLGETMFSGETREHLIRATTEIILAVDSMIPREMIPDEVKQHYLAAKREGLLLVRAILDAHINLVRDIESKEQPPETGLRKIELE